MLSTQNLPWNMVDSLAQRPVAAKTQEGYLFFDRDAGDGYVLVIDPTTKVRSWKLFGGGSGSAGEFLTSTDLSAYIGRWVRMQPTSNMIELAENSPGGPALGILQSVTTLGGAQWGRVVTSGPALAVTDGVAIPASTPITDDVNAKTVAWVFGQTPLGVTLAASSGSSVLIQVLAAHADQQPYVNPQFYVSSTNGNDQNDGTPAHPFATPDEAFRRLDLYKWYGNAEVWIVNALNLGDDPIWNIPTPLSGVQPLSIHGLMTQVVGASTPTGGTSGSLTTPSNATVTSAVAGAANAYRSMQLRFIAGALSGERAPISTNDGAGGFSLGGTISAAPGADPANRFVIEDHLGSVTYSGVSFHISAPGGVHIDNLLITSGTDTEIILSGHVQTTGCKIVAGGAGSTYLGINDGVWVLGCLRLPIFNLPPGVTGCGDYLDGSNNDTFYFGDGIGTSGTHYAQGCVFRAVDITAGGMRSIVQFEECVFNSCAFPMQFSNWPTFNLSYSVVNSPRRSLLLLGAPFDFANVDFLLAYNNINAAAALPTVINAVQCTGVIDGSLIGANPAATRCFDAHSSSDVRLLISPAMTSGSANNVKVGALAAAPWATVYNGGVSLQAVQTDLANAASEMVRVGP